MPKSKKKIKSVKKVSESKKISEELIIDLPPSQPWPQEWLDLEIPEFLKRDSK